MDALKHGNSRYFALLASCALAFGIAGCSGDDGNNGAAGAPGAPGAPGAGGQACWDLNNNGVGDLPEEDTNGDGVVDVNDCRATGDTILIGNGSTLTEEQIEELGGLVAVITAIEVSSPPVVTFEVEDIHGNPALGITGGINMTLAKLIPASGGNVAYWQSYVNRVETANPNANTPNVLPQAVQATTDGQGTIEELGGGAYTYTFATDVTDVTTPIPVSWEPSLTHRVGMEIRLSGEAELLAPDNPVLDFVPDGGAGSGNNQIVSTAENCDTCHYRFDLHGGPRRTVEYCVTCHNPGTIDQDTGESLDMKYMTHSIHPGEDRVVPYIIYGYGDFVHDYTEVTYPQDLLFCETCHEESALTPDGNLWNETSTAATCGGCHAPGLISEDPDAVTGQPTYKFDHGAAGADGGFTVVADDYTCNTCHLGAITGAGTALAVHSKIDGSQRFRYETGLDYVLSIVSATNTDPGQTPTITFRVDKPDGTAWDIVNDPEFTDAAASLNLYVAWDTGDIYNGDELGNTGGLRDRGNGIEPYGAGEPYRYYLNAMIAAPSFVQNADGSYTVDYFAATPVDYTGDIMIGLGGHPAAFATDADGVATVQRAAARSAVFYPGTPRVYRASSENCDACHKQVQFHGSNRNGNTEICLVCHTPDLAEDPDSFQFGNMIHRIHTANETYAGGAFAEVTYPQSVANCERCHIPDGFNAARSTARAVSTSLGADEAIWLDDIATTPNATACGACHTSTGAAGHFESQGGQVDEPKDTIIGADANGGIPNGQEACVVCHGTGAAFDTANYHHAGE